MVKPFRKADSARLHFLSVEDQKKLAVACPPDFMRIVQAALFTGVRSGEGLFGRFTCDTGMCS